MGRRDGGGGRRLQAGALRRVRRPRRHRRALAVELASRVERELVAKLVEAGSLDAGVGLRLAVDALISLVLDEPEVYGFMVRCIRASDRELLDNTLVRTLHSRMAMLSGVLAPDGDQVLLGVLADGMFGFLFAAVESWQATRTPPHEELVDAIVTIVLRGFEVVGGKPRPVR